MSEAQRPAHVVATGRRYRRLLRGCEQLARLPMGLARPLSHAWMRLAVPDSEREAAWQAGLAAAPVAADRALALTLYRRSCADAILNVFLHDRFDAAWLAHHVDHDANVIAQIRDEGAAHVLTWHSPYYHTFFVVLGLLGCRMRPLVRPETISPHFPEIGAYLRRLHEGCRGQFNGGDYAFIDGRDDALAAAEAGFAAGEVVASLHDNRTLSERPSLLTLFGRSFNIGTGLLDSSLSRDVPTYFGGLIAQGSGYRLVLRKLPAAATVEARAMAYLAALENTLGAHPEAWELWDQWAARGATEEPPAVA